MAWSYMVICIFDFLVAPILWTWLQAKIGVPLTQWFPITLQGGGLYHMAMGGVLGITAWTRGQEKLKFFDLNNGNGHISEPQLLNEEKK